MKPPCVQRYAPLTAATRLKADVDMSLTACYSGTGDERSLSCHFDWRSYATSCGRHGSSHAYSAYLHWLIWPLSEQSKLAQTERLHVSLFERLMAQQCTCIPSVHLVQRIL